jgi:hypothetical protein
MTRTDTLEQPSLLPGEVPADGKRRRGARAARPAPALTTAQQLGSGI